ncbi:MAG: hypothetical protein ACLFTR_03805 [Candidatus Woesearchaeota archaeon]
MKTRIFILMMLLTLVLSGVQTYASDSNLTIERAYARVDDGRWEKIDDGWFDEELYPMDEIEVEVRIENDFEREDGLRIRDVEAELYIEGLGSGRLGYIEENKRISSLSPGNRRTFSFRFEIPFDVYEDYYDAEITVSGVDENGTVHEDDLIFNVDVIRNYNELYMDTLELTRTRVSCTNTRSGVEIDMHNIGMNDLDDVRVSVKNDELGIDREESDIALDSIEYDSRRARYEKIFSFNVAEDAEPGTYYVDVKVHADGSEQVSEQLKLEVLECPRDEPEEDEENNGIIITDPEEQPTPPPVERPPREEPEDDEDTIYLVLLATLNVLMLIGIVVLVIVATGTKRRGRTRFY